MIEQVFVQILLMLGTSVAAVILFQKLHIPSSLGYLMVGVLFGAHTPGPVIDVQQIREVAEFGIVFLLFTIGLSFSLPQIHALRGQVLSLGTGQVVLTTALIGTGCWLLGLPPATSFVIGAVFAQSSTTIISKQLAEQGEENSRHGRLGVAMSVFQDVTAVPLIVVIPVLGVLDGDAGVLFESLGWAMAKAIVAFLLVFILGRWLLRPLFHGVAARRSTELFTLTVLFVSLLAAWTTSQLGLSMAFGAFLVGMMLGETEFRHQVESTIRPFRDVLIGLFFVSIGMLFDPAAIPQNWQWASLGAVAMLVSKTLLVTLIVRWSGLDGLTAWRTGFLLAVGGEFGFALLAIALDVNAIANEYSQIVFTSVLFSMIAAPFLIRYNHVLAGLLVRRSIRRQNDPETFPVSSEATQHLHDHAIICGYGRIGQSVGHFLEEEKIPYVAVDLDSTRIKEAHVAGEPVYYGDSSERDILEALGVDSAKLLVISYDDVLLAKKILHHVRTLRPDLPVMVRTRDEVHVDELRQAGATEVVPEVLEAGLMIASHALLLLNVPFNRVVRRMQQQRAGRYRLLRELYPGEDASLDTPDTLTADGLRSILIVAGSKGVGKKLSEFVFDDVTISSLVRQGNREENPLDVVIAEGDVVVLFGAPGNLDSAERLLLG
ncbi:cation:proton antiporter [Methylotuvimicrobium sp.]|uniref:cation:proton antiporter domain-containing protein n=1 Tax=Methylotuvimicrobium sp. TaxID=2822413 RepID=UPI003D662A95